MDSGTAATNGTTATGGKRSSFSASGFTAGATSGTESGRRLRRMMGNNPFIMAGAARTQMALMPMATCFQFVPSLTARHGMPPVPPAVR